MTAPSTVDGGAAGDWIEWSGGEQPVADDVRVELKLGNRNPEYAEGLAGRYTWSHANFVKAFDAHITAYRVVQP